MMLIALIAISYAIINLTIHTFISKPFPLSNSYICADLFVDNGITTADKRYSKRHRCALSLAKYTFHYGEHRCP